MVYMSCARLETLVDGTTEPNTEKSRRTIPLIPLAVEALHQHRVRQQERRLAAGPVWKDQGWIFCNVQGGPLYPEHPDLWPFVEDRMNELFPAIERNQQQNGTPEDVRAYAKQQFQKRLTRIGRARTQSLEQIYHLVEGEDRAE